MNPADGATAAHDAALITTVAAALGLALILGFLANRVRIPPLVGYLLAGVLIGPGTPGFVADVGGDAAQRRGVAGRRNSVDAEGRAVQPLAPENGDEFFRYYHRGASGELGRFILVVEGSVPDEGNKAAFTPWRRFSAAAATAPIPTR